MPPPLAPTCRSASMTLVLEPRGEGERERDDKTTSRRRARTTCTSRWGCVSLLNLSDTSAQCPRSGNSTATEALRIGWQRAAAEGGQRARALAAEQRQRRCQCSHRRRETRDDTRVLTKIHQCAQRPARARTSKELPPRARAQPGLTTGQTASRLQALYGSDGDRRPVPKIVTTEMRRASCARIRQPFRQQSASAAQSTMDGTRKEKDAMQLQSLLSQRRGARSAASDTPPRTAVQGTHAIPLAAAAIWLALRSRREAASDAEQQTSGDALKSELAQAFDGILAALQRGLGQKDDRQPIVARHTPTLGARPRPTAKTADKVGGW